jgi:MMP 1-O-methyltransferase
MTKRADVIAAQAEATPGFLTAAEGALLRALAARAARSSLGPLVEIGAYLGRSTLYLAAGIADAAVVARLWSVDHHSGSEEMQRGWPAHDPSLVDPATGAMESLPRWRRAVTGAGATDLVVGVIGDSAAVAADWSTPLSLVFIDGGHAPEVCRADYLGWAPRLAPGGLLVFHDVFADPADGGQGPHDCYREAIGSGSFTEEPAETVGSLRVLARVGRNTAEVAVPPARRSAASRTAAVE